MTWKRFPHWWPFVGSAPVTGGFPAQSVRDAGFDGVFAISLDKLLDIHSSEMRRLNAHVMSPKDFCRTDVPTRVRRSKHPMHAGYWFLYHNSTMSLSCHNLRLTRWKTRWITLDVNLYTRDASAIMSLRPRVTHTCVGKLTIIGSDNALSPCRRQDISWTNAGITAFAKSNSRFFPDTKIITIIIVQFWWVHKMHASGHFLCEIYWLFALTHSAPGV